MRELILAFAVLGMFVAVLAVVGVLDPSGPGNEPAPRFAVEDDEEALTERELDILLEENLERTLQEDARLINGEFKVRVEDRIAFLTGAVDSEVDRTYLEEAARDVEGILGVDNSITLKEIEE